MREWTAPILAYLLLALVITLPFRGIVGSPDIDVWNHVWGYWWFAQALATGSLPWHTDLLGAPNGGVLYFVDPVGAVAALPLTWLCGPAIGYTAVLVARVTLAGLACHALCAEVFGRGPHAYVAGAAFAGTPFLLCELANGISEVTAVWYVPATLALAVRALRSGRLRDYARVGLFGGLSTLANFYYGLATALLVGPFWIAQHRSVPWRPLLKGAALTAAIALLVAMPGLLALRGSVGSPDALIRRMTTGGMNFAAHNAVDPRVYFMPGAFSSVDLQARYGEPFRHTGYLRLSLLALAAIAIRREWVRTRGLIATGAVSLVLGLGPFLWWDGDWVRVGSSILSLPFEWCQRWVPDLSITHPLRLSIGAQAVVCALAGGALSGRALGGSTLAGIRLRRSLFGLALLLPLLETAFGSNATWPLPSAPASVPALYEAIAADPDPRAVLDLPAEVGTTMASSRYFLFQTVHRHPVPYKPDARAGSSGDPATFTLFPHATGAPGQRGRWALPPLTPDGAAHLRSVYGWVIVHADLTRRIDAEGLFEAALTPALGAPTIDGDRAIWRLSDAR